MIAQLLAFLGSISSMNFGFLLPTSLAFTSALAAKRLSTTGISMGTLVSSAFAHNVSVIWSETKVRKIVYIIQSKDSSLTCFSFIFDQLTCFIFTVGMITGFVGPIVKYKWFNFLVDLLCYSRCLFFGTCRGCIFSRKWWGSLFAHNRRWWRWTTWKTSQLLIARSYICTN